MFTHTQLRNQPLIRLLPLILLLFSFTTIRASHPIRMAAYPSLSPDGSMILFSWHGDIWIAAATGGKAERLTTHPAWDFAPQFTPDGKSVIFGSTRAGESQVFSMPVKGGLTRQLTFHTESSMLEDISPDGKSVLIRALRDYPGRKPYRLYQLDLEDAEDATDPPIEKLAFAATAQSGQYSPDGKSILFTREGVETYRKGYHGTMASQIWIYSNASYTQPVKSPYGCRTPFPHPDGSGFYYTKGSPNGFNLWFHPKNGTDRQVTQFKDDSVLQPSISAQGNAIIFRHLFDLYLLPLTNGKDSPPEPKKIDLWHEEDLELKDTQERIIKTTNDISFSPSGLEIVFTAEGDLWAMDTVLRKPNRLTETPGHEEDVWFSHDGKSILYIYDDGINKEIRQLDRSDTSQFWWEAGNCQHTVIIKAESRPESLYPGPRGKKIAYTTYPGDLWVCQPDGSEPTRLVESWHSPRVSWSPDGKWIAYNKQDNNFNPDIYIIPSDGGSAPVNISQHPDIDHLPAWSPNGRRLAFVGRHHKEEYDIFYIDLYKSDRVKDKDGETRDRARKAMKKDPAYKSSAKRAVKKVIKNLTSDKKKKEKEKEVFDLKNIHQRLQKISIKGTTPSKLIWNKDSKTILFQSKKEKSTYSVEAKPGAKPSKFADASGTPIKMTDKGKLYWLSEGVPASLSSGKNTKYPFSIYTHRKAENWKRMVFRTAWRTMRDSFYDPAMNHRNWNTIRDKYEPMAVQAPNSMIFSRIASMMLGELNASHTGFRPTTWPKAWIPPRRWKEATVHLGLRFDPTHSDKGWKVSKVFAQGPADQTISKIEVGEIITKIDGVEIAANTPITRFLNRRPTEPINLTIINSEGEVREVKIMPISYANARNLAKNERIDATAAAVDKLSAGKLGYIHLARMMWDEFEKFEHHLYEQGAGKDGLVIDVRNNGGGFTTDHLLTALCQPQHAFTIPRNGEPGYPQDRIVYATWNKPIIVLCNQNSFSNAEIFSHAIRNLNRGTVVGVATAGGVISTGSVKIMDAGSMRLPFRGWFSSKDGADMELNGAQPHITLWNQPGELSQEKDVQLEKAVQVLLEESKNTSGFPKAKYRAAK